MSEKTEQITHRDRRSSSGIWLMVLLVLLPVLYILSPPWVAKMLGPNYLAVEWYIPFYYPLGYLSEQFEIVNGFYEGYFRLVGVL